MQHGKEKGFVQHATVPGTGLFLSLRTDRPVDLSETFIEERSWTYIDAEAERATYNGGLCIRDECVHTGSRPPATGLRRKILTLLSEMSDPLILDFEGIQSASSSFLDELLGRLAQELGIAAFRSRIRIVNVPDRIRGMAQVVIRQRLDDSVPDKEDHSIGEGV